MRALTNRHRLHNRIAGNFVVILREVTDQRDGDEVQHDRVDDFMRAKPRFQDAGNRAPERAHQDRSHKTQRNQAATELVRECDSDPRGRERGDVELSFSADVE